MDASRNSVLNDGVVITIKILSAAIQHLRDNEFFFRRVRDRWITDDTLVNVIVAMEVLSPSLCLTGRRLNSLLSTKDEWKSQYELYDYRNSCHVNRVKYGKNGTFYYLRSEGKTVNNPTICAAWRNKVVAKQQSICKTFDDERASIRSSVISPSPSKRPRIGPTPPAVTDKPPPAAITDTVKRLLAETNWDSPEAFALFNPIENDLSTRQTLERRVNKLTTVLQNVDGYKNIILGGDPKKVCTESDIFKIRQRSLYLRAAYSVALKNDWQYNGDHSWENCCKEAVEKVNDLGFDYVKNGETVERWNKVFRETEYFPHPNPALHLGKKPEPPMLAKFQELRNRINQFCLNNLQRMTLDMVRDEIVSKILPSLYEQWKIAEEGPRSFVSLDGFLRLHNLTKVSASTIWRWVRYIGYSYCEKRKSFYVDGHERPDVVDNRIHYCKQYLLDEEPRCLRWKCLPLAEALEIEEIVKRFGKTTLDEATNQDTVKLNGVHHYFDESRTMRVEFHEDDVHDIAAFDELPLLMSERAKGCMPLIILGQDECIVCQYLVGTHFWSGPNGEIPMMPKTDGAIIMISAFTGRALGFGRFMTAEELLQVNAFRKDKEYVSTEAALKLYFSF